MIHKIVEKSFSSDWSLTWNGILPVAWVKKAIEFQTIIGGGGEEKVGSQEVHDCNIVFEDWKCSNFREILFDEFGLLSETAELTLGVNEKLRSGIIDKYFRVGCNDVSGMVAEPGSCNESWATFEEVNFVDDSGLNKCTFHRDVKEMVWLIKFENVS